MTWPTIRRRPTSSGFEATGDYTNLFQASAEKILWQNTGRTHQGVCPTATTAVTDGSITNRPGTGSA